MRGGMTRSARVLETPEPTKAPIECCHEWSRRRPLCEGKHVPVRTSGGRGDEVPAMDAESLCNPSAARRAPPLALRRPAAMIRHPAMDHRRRATPNHPNNIPAIARLSARLKATTGPKSLFSTLLRRTTSPDTLGSQNPACGPAHRQPVVTAWQRSARGIKTGDDPLSSL